LHGGECRISVALVGDELAAHFRRAQAGRETMGTELGGGLTLAIDHRFDVGQQVGEMGFHTLATACHKGIEAGAPAVSCVGPFTNGHPAPPECTCRTPLSPSPQLFDGAGHKQPSGTALERFCCLDEQRLERVREFHGDSSRKDVPGVYHRSGLVLFSKVP
jgi:hypothetical protein